MKQLVFLLSLLTCFASTALAGKITLKFNSATFSPIVVAYGMDSYSKDGKWKLHNFKWINSSRTNISIGSKTFNTPTIAKLESLTRIEETVSSIYVKFSTKISCGTVDSMRVIIADDPEFKENVITYKFRGAFSTTEAKECQFTLTEPQTNKYYSLQLHYKQSKNNSSNNYTIADISQIVFNTLEPAMLSFPKDNYYAVLNESFTAPVVNNPNYILNSYITYSSSNPEVAEVNENDGSVTIKDIGTTIITCKSRKYSSTTTGYAPCEVSYTLTVGDGAAMFDFTLADDLLRYADNGDLEPTAGEDIANGDLSGVTFTNGIVTLTINDTPAFYRSSSSAPRWYLNGSKPELQLFPGNELTAAITDNGYKIVCVDFPKGTGDEFDPDMAFEPGSGTYKDRTWTAGKEIVTRLKAVPTTTCNAGKINVVYASDPGAAATAISNIAEGRDDAPVEYYNLSGIRVDKANLVPGIYIRRQGAKATKVYIK